MASLIGRQRVREKELAPFLNYLCNTGTWGGCGRCESACLRDSERLNMPR